MDEMTAALGRTRGMVAVKLSRLRGNSRRWTEWETVRVLAWRAAGWDYERIAKRLHRTVAAVRQKAVLQRKRALADPRKRQVLQVLAFATDPARILKAMRDHRITDCLERGEDEHGIRI